MFFLSSFVVVILSVYALASGWRPWPLARDEGQVSKGKGNPSAARDTFAATARQAAQGVVAIQTVGRGNVRNLGAGFFVDSRGLVATNSHVVSNATEAQVRLVDGRVFRVAGYAAAYPAQDLAILQIESPPPDAWSLQLAESSTRIRAAARVMAIGHPRGVQFSLVDGRVSRWVATHDLDDDAQRFVRRLTHSDDDLRWIQHSAALAEGNSGGPLLNEKGQVVGVNTWISRETGANYALDAAYLAQVLADLDVFEVEPLADRATIDAQAAAVVARLTAARANELFAQAEALQWLPTTRQEYRPLQELALAMVSAHLPQSFQGDHFDRQRSDELAHAVTQIENQLRTRKSFGSPEQITIINELAEPALAQPELGVFFFAEVERVVSNSQGQRGMLMELVGSRQTLFVPLDGQLLEPVAGTIYGVFGINLRGDVVRYGDNPLQLIVAPVIISRTLIEVKH
jgi:S1-C subfamily serine protease